MKHKKLEASFITNVNTKILQKAFSKKLKTILPTLTFLRKIVYVKQIFWRRWLIYFWQLKSMIAVTMEIQYNVLLYFHGVTLKGSFWRWILKRDLALLTVWFLYLSLKKLNFVKPSSPGQKYYQMINNRAL